MRCKKLGGKEVPRSYRVFNGKKDYCKDLFVTDEKRVNYNTKRYVTKE